MGGYEGSRAACKDTWKECQVHRSARLFDVGARSHGLNFVCRGGYPERVGALLPAPTVFESNSRTRGRLQCEQFISSLSTGPGGHGNMALTPGVL